MRDVYIRCKHCTNNWSPETLDSASINDSKLCEDIMQCPTCGHTSFEFVLLEDEAN